MIVNAFWLYGELQPINLLTIRSFQEHGHEVIIYAYDKLPNAGCEVRQLEPIISKKQMYFYKAFDEPYKIGGFAEYVKATLINKIGGWHIDLDVACLKSFSEFDKQEYVFRPHKLGIVANIIKMPANCELSKFFVKWTSMNNEHNTNYERGFGALYHLLVHLNLTGYIVSGVTFGLDEDKYLMPYITNCGAIANDNVYAIHWCGALGHVKNYEPNSFYHSLLKKYGII